jgi:hypothetical protein
MQLCPFVIDEVVCGGARGVDWMGSEWAKDNAIPVMYFSADWYKYNKAAGVLRNKQMADYADALVYLRYESTPGTANMIQQMIKQNKPTWGVTIASTTVQDYVCRINLQE